MTDLLPGQIAYVFVVAVLDAALLSWLTLRWYARSVRRLMKARSPGSAAATSVPRPAGRSPERASVPEHLAFDFGDDTTNVDLATIASLAESGALRHNRRRLALAYGTGAALYGVVTTLAVLFGSWSSTPLAAWMAVWWAHLWPLVPTLAVLLVFDRRRVVVATATYLALGAALVSLVTLANQVVHGRLNSAPLTNVYGVAQLIVVTAAFPLALVLPTTWRRIRGVMPLAVASTVLFGLASLLFRQVIIAAFNRLAVRNTLLNLSALTSADFMYYGLFMIAALPVGWIVWRVLARLARAFAGKRFSDLQLVVDCWWAIVAATATGTDFAVTFGAAGIGVGVAAFAAYRLGVEVVLQQVAFHPVPFRRLLLLRVFGYQARTESLFDSVAQAWRFRGPVRLVAGADLATRTADPGDILALLAGRLAAQYIAEPADVDRRVTQLDDTADPDGRFRIDELFCRDETWRAALAALLDVSDVVLMDLRSFSPRNAGCLFEIEQLVIRLPIDRIVLITDETTDVGLLQRTLDDAWTDARRAGHARGSGHVTIRRVERQDLAERQRLTATLVSAAGFGR